MMAKLKFYIDTHVARAVAIQLRRHDIEVVRCEEIGLAEVDDDVHLQYAAEHGYIMVTQDDDFAGLHAQWQYSGKRHGGIMLLPKQLAGEQQVSYAVRQLLDYARLIEQGAGSYSSDIENQIIFL